MSGLLERDPLFERIIEEVPHYDRFYTVDELRESGRRLAARHPELVRHEVVGHSRAGEPIDLLVIGSGRRRALLFGFPHPNEPIGAMMLEYLSWRLAEDAALRQALDYTFYIVKVADVDGARLNHGWFSGPFTPWNYAWHFYRPAAFDQVEWTFPIRYKRLVFDRPIPETQALMRIMDETRPDFVYSLHNAGFGGVYFYVSDPCPELVPVYHRLARERDLPLQRGEPEMPWAEKLAEAVYRMPSTRDTYDYYERYAGRDPLELLVAGTSSLDYARGVNPDAFVLVCEMPYFYDRRIDDPTPTDVRRRDAVLDAADRSERLYRFLQAQLELAAPYEHPDNPFRRAARNFVEQGLKSLEPMRAWARQSPELDRPATVAELFDNRLARRFYQLLLLGLVRRYLDWECRRLGNEPVLADALQRVEEEMRRWHDGLVAELDYRVIPIRDLVQVQLGSALYTAAYLQERGR